MLGIIIWLDGGKVDITGVIDTEGVIATTPSVERIVPFPLLTP
jgi:hypothetical protein